MIAAIPAILIEMGFFQVTAPYQYLGGGLIIFLNIFVGVALVEEVLKYLVVREKVLSSPEFDEPIDAMLYMIIAALGFAASENILIFFSPKGFSREIFETLSLAGFRFISATFLHALTSGLLGYFLALSFFETRKHFRFITLGLVAAIFLHGLYNFSIMEVEGSLRFGIPIVILMGLAIFVSLGFKKLKKLASICKIK